MTLNINARKCQQKQKTGMSLYILECKQFSHNTVVFLHLSSIFYSIDGRTEV